MSNTRASAAGISRNSVVEEQHAGLERPYKSGITDPSGDKAFGANFQPLDLVWG